MYRRALSAKKSFCVAVVAFALFFGSVLVGALAGREFAAYKLADIAAAARQEDPDDPLDGLAYLGVGFVAIGAGAGAVVGWLLVAAFRNARSTEEEPADSIGRVDHINLVVSDLERSVRFYTELLGFRETRRARLSGAWIEAVAGLAGVDADVVYVQPPGDGPRIELLCYRSPKGASCAENARANTVGLRHVAFRVDDLDVVCRQLEEAGVEFVGAPTVVPSGVVKHDEGRKRLCYFRDPDGVLLEFAEYT